MVPEPRSLRFWVPDGRVWLNGTVAGRSGRSDAYRWQRPRRDHHFRNRRPSDRDVAVCYGDRSCRSQGLNAEEFQDERSISQTVGRKSPPRCWSLVHCHWSPSGSGQPDAVLITIISSHPKGGATTSLTQLDCWRSRACAATLSSTSAMTCRSCGWMRSIS